MKASVSLGIEGEGEFLVPAGTALITAADEENLPLRFGCREGGCGTCLVAVLEGTEGLSPPTECERILIPLLTDESNARLACQLRVNGPTKVRLL